MTSLGAFAPRLSSPPPISIIDYASRWSHVRTSRLMLYVKYNGKHKLLSPRCCCCCCCCCFGVMLDNNDPHNWRNFSNILFEFSSPEWFCFISLLEDKERERERKKLRENRLHNYIFSCVMRRKMQKSIKFRIEKFLIRINYVFNSRSMNLNTIFHTYLFSRFICGMYYEKDFSTFCEYPLRILSQS